MCLKVCLSRSHPCHSQLQTDLGWPSLGCGQRNSVHWSRAGISMALWHMCCGVHVVQFFVVVCSAVVEAC